MVAKQLCVTLLLLVSVCQLAVCKVAPQPAEPTTPAFELPTAEDSNYGEPTAEQLSELKELTRAREDPMSVDVQENYKKELDFYPEQEELDFASQSKLCLAQHLFYADNKYMVGISPNPLYPWTPGLVLNPHEFLLGGGSLPWIRVSARTEYKISLPLYTHQAARLFWLCWDSWWFTLHAVTVTIKDCRCNNLLARSYFTPPPFSFGWQTQCFPILPAGGLRHVKSIDLMFHNFFNNHIYLRNLRGKMCSDTC